MKKGFNASMLIVLLLGIIFIMPTTIGQSSIAPNENGAVLDEGEGDLDPNNDLYVTVEIIQIRAFERMNRIPFSLEYIDFFTNPDLYVKVFINGEVYKSPVWHNTRYIYQQPWTATCNVPDDQEFVNITIQLWDWNLGINHLCDISREYYGNAKDTKEIELQYSLKTGHWGGDDFLEHDPLNVDISGYGRASGCDDGSIYDNEGDCEIWFDIYQNDSDGDGIPYWSETEIYETDPTVDDSGWDPDGDELPIEYEHKWGHEFSYDYHSGGYDHYWYWDPLTYDNHRELDLDDDGLNNYEEYIMRGWGSDPTRQDIFIEADYMAESPNGFLSKLPLASQELIKTSFHRRNIIIHFDDGRLLDCFGDGPVISDCDEIPFEEELTWNDQQGLYYEWFIHGDTEAEKQGIFHYGPTLYNCGIHGNAFWSGVDQYISHQVSLGLVEGNKVVPKIPIRRHVSYASVYMHELGHTLGIFNGNTPGCDDQNGKYPWNANFWKWGAYKSCMNYRYTYMMVDYSDGSRGTNDFNDWEKIELTYFQRTEY